MTNKLASTRPFLSKINLQSRHSSRLPFQLSSPGAQSGIFQGRGGFLEYGHFDKCLSNVYRGINVSCREYKRTAPQGGDFGISSPTCL